MASISSPGVGSNLDVSGIVSKLMSVERAPLTALDTKEAGLQAKISALGSIKGSLSSLQSAASALSSTSKFNAISAKVADTEVATASATTSAAAGTYTLEVKKLAQAHKLASAPSASSTTTIGSGKITIEYGTISGGAFTANPDRGIETLTIDPSKSRLSDIRDAINAANLGITANIITDSSGARLAISSKETGAANALKITVDDNDGVDTDTTGLSALAFDPAAAAGSGKNMTVTQDSQNAEVLLEGLTVTSAKNTLTDAIDGVTINLLKAKDGTPTKLTVASDTSAAKSAIDAFVKAYNDVNKTLRDLSSYDATTKKGGILLGEGTIRNIQGTLRSVLSGSINNPAAGVSNLSEIGISFKRDGSLSVDSTKLSAALSDPTKDIAALFASVGKSSESTLKVDGITTSTAPGNYDIDISQLATQGKSTGSLAVTFPLTLDSSNSTLDVSVNGLAVSVSLTQKSYTTGDSLAQEIQQRINGATKLSSAGLSVKVSQSGGIFAITSTTYGSDSKVDILDTGNAKAAIFGASANVDGVNIAGKIAGIDGTGTGQTLKAENGKATGLAVRYSENQTGKIGSVTVTQGLAYQLNQTISQILADDGLLDARVDGLGASVTAIGKQREALQRRLNDMEKRYLAQYNSLDTMISKMQSTSNYLSQQLATLSKSS